LVQGRADAQTVYAEDAAQPAMKFKEAGAEWVHVVDLDGAFTGKQANAEAVEAILASGLKVQLGGGIRSIDIIKHWLNLGVERVVIGTKAVTDPNFLHKCLQHVPSDKIAVGIDAKDGKVAVKGWIEKVDLLAVEFAYTVQATGIHTIIYTDISRDGMMTGPNFEAQIEMLEELDVDIIASGGVASIADLQRFKEIGATHPNLDGVITGKAIYDGELDVAEAIRLIQS
ncbi:MAG TPA: 1-(5-phosphoribosyl)-5-[(5-phosphoribosylamino)methylideneamino]imidazole-4-carboxamide isomerase, partial [Oceanipulchritudo sp.]|nr:1-(5-phosphoribosyl)-5-[(5-phosphoribosylamino)methylideneamino]imidazole-4-carboxamide isomerase [Oceanipulchritudo sp.]